MIKFFLLAIALILSSYADENLSKRSLKSNYQFIYNKSQKEVENFSQIFSQGEFYGRLRSNSFYFRWANEDEKHSTNLVSGLGGSFVYKSATFGGFDFTTALYASQSFFDENQAPVAHLKPAKDTLSRFDYANTGSKSMAVLGEAYIRYSGFKESELIFGRQLFESFYTKSNDSKMIPNTFDGIVLNTKALKDTKISFAYLAKEKLRDHTQSHSVLMYGDENSSSSLEPNWSSNDDSVMHKGLTYSALKAANKPTDAPLIIGEIHNNSIQNLKLDTSFYSVPELLSQAMFEANYRINFDGFSITPAFRYLRQFDNGAGDVGGASYTGDSTAYHDENSLDSQMIAARVVAKIREYKINLAYTDIFDEADLINPFRGFPTAGYTRSMGVYNWRANTQSYRIELKYNDNKKGIYKNLFIQSSLLYINGDEEKTGYHNEDKINYYLGFVQNIPSLIDLQWRLRLGYTHFLDSKDSDFNYLDSRFELNYLF
jgi:hypothetical protein